MQIGTARDLGTLIRERRKALNLGQQDLADRVGVGRQWVVGVEQGKPGAGVGLVLRTLHALGLKLQVDDGTEMDVHSPVGALGIDIDAVIDKARGRSR